MGGNLTMKEAMLWVQLTGFRDCRTSRSLCFSCRGLHALDIVYGCVSIISFHFIIKCSYHLSPIIYDLQLMHRQILQPGGPAQVEELVRPEATHAEGSRATIHKYKFLVPRNLRF